MRGIRRILAYWRVERRTIRQGFAAMALASLASLAAGIILGSIGNTLQLLPGLLILIPAAVATRGNVFGAMGSRLATGVHAGLFVPTRERSGLLYQNVYAATILTFSTSFLIAVLAKTLAVAFGLESISLLDLMVISILGGVLASLAVGGFAVTLSVLGYREGWDLDSVSAPLVTSAGDLFTIPALFAATFAVRISWLTPVVAGLLIAVTILLTIRGLFTELVVTRRVLRESLPVLAFAATVDIMAGLVLQSSFSSLVAFPVFLALVPPIIGDAGGLGGILSSRLSSKLHLGVLPPQGWPRIPALLDFTLIYLFAVLVYPLLGVVAHFTAGALDLASPGLPDVVGVSLVAGLIATSFAVFVAYYAAVATYRLGLDPDNHGIPLLTSSMDFLGVIAIVVSLAMFGIT
jgi:mgtE-like transporter